MRTFKMFILQWSISFTIIQFYLTRADNKEFTDEKFTYDDEELEKMFYKLHPDIKNITWREADNLTPEMHKKVCDQVLEQIRTDSDEETNYTFIDVPKYRIQSERIMRDPLLGMDADVAFPIVIICVYDNKKFYITKADDNHVFRVRLARGTCVFELQSGLHPVHYN